MAHCTRLAVAAAAMGLLCASTASAQPSSLIGAFRPPAAPLIVQSPFISVWSAADKLYEANTTHWSGAASNLAGLVQVDGAPAVVFMGGAASIGLSTATQLGAPAVYATNTLYSFAVPGSGSSAAVMLNVTFTTPLVVPNGSFPFNAGPGSPDLFTLPVTYISWAAQSMDGAGHRVRVYVDLDATLVTNNSYATTTPVAWERVMNGTGGGGAPPGLQGLRVGAASQWPLDPVVCGQSEPLTASQTIVWGWMYGLCSTCNSSSAGSTWASRAAFVTGQALPPDDPAPPKAVGDGFPGLAFAWEARVGGSGSSSSSSSGSSTATTTTAAPTATGFITLFMDEVLSHNYSFDGLDPPVIMPPYWRRELQPYNDTQGVPTDTLVTAHGQYGQAMQGCAEWDARLVADIMAAAAGPTGAPNATEGAASMAALTSLSYRQVLGHHSLAWHPGQGRAWYFLKEIASGGDDSTMDVIFPASPLLLSYSPSLLADLLIPILEASSADAYHKDWVAHDLGKFPIANRMWGGQEDMPVEETANLLLMIAAIGYLNNSNLDTFQPYYDTPLGFTRWGDFLLASLPFPRSQGTTDDFLGSTANGTNLVVKGCAGLGAYGYIQWVMGNRTGAVDTWTAAGACGAALVEFGWYTPPAPSTQPGHFAWSYELAQGPGGGSSFFCMYNFLFVRLLRQDNLLPNQTYYLSQQQQFFALDGSGVGETYGVPLINGSAGMKLDWNTALAVALYDQPATPAALPLPSPFSSSVFVGMLAGANATNLRAPLTDFFSAKDATYGGKYRGRPVMGGAWAPVALARLAALPTMDHEAPMAAAFEQGHAQWQGRHERHERQGQ